MGATNLEIFDGEPDTVSGACTLDWPEHPVPADIDSTDLATLEEHGTRVVWGEGRPDAPIMIVLDNPGAKEDRDGNPFVCGTRLTLRDALREAGIAAGDCYVTFLIKRRPRRAYDRADAHAAYKPLLDRQIATGRPRVLVFTGATVVNALLDPDIEIKHARGRRFVYAGVPVIAAYHPLAARRRPQLFPSLVADLSLAQTIAMSPRMD